MRDHGRTLAVAALSLTLLMLMGASAGVARSIDSGSPAAKRAHPGRGHGAGKRLEKIFAEGVRTLDGSGNNLRHRDWGRAGMPYSRVALPNYADGLGAMTKGPNSRYVSNRVFNDVAQNLFSENGVTQWGFAWGQFLDHTFGLRKSGADSAPVTFDSKDPLEEFKNDLGEIPFARSAAAPGTGATSPSQQINTVSSYIDAWGVYGGTPERLEWLREGPVDGDLSNNGPHLIETAGGYLPRADARGDVKTAPFTDPIGGRLMAAPEKAVVAGDVRANENIALTSVHTLFMREHNRIVDALPQRLPSELKFEIARRVVGAEIQFITYGEFLPALGIALDPYRGYKPDVDPTLSNEFATVGYRAHSMIHGELDPKVDIDALTPEQLEDLEAQGAEVEQEGDERGLVVPLNVAFGNPGLVPQLGLEAILAGLGGEAEYRNDEMIDNQLRSVLFQLPAPGAEDPSACLDGPTLPECFTMVMDLGALDIERGRDHGMPYYNDLRRAYGLSPKRSFTDITGETSDRFPKDGKITASHPIDDPNILDFVYLADGDGNELEPDGEEASAAAVSGTRRTTLAARLKAIYGEVDHLDAFVGMLAEPHVPGTEFGKLQLLMWKREFERLRDGDRFFYLNDPSLRLIKQRFGFDYWHTLADVIEMNTDVQQGDVQPNVFKVAP
jgi:peroxidase